MAKSRLGRLRPRLLETVASCHNPSKCPVRCWAEMREAPLGAAPGPLHSTPPVALGKRRGTSPQEFPTLGAATEASRHVLDISLPFIFLERNAVDIVKGQLLAFLNILDGKEGQIVKVLVSMIANAGKDPQFRLARVIDESRGTRHELAVHFQGRSPEPRIERRRISELVEGEEVDVLALRDGGGSSAPVGLGRRDNLAKVAVDELTFLDGLLCAYTCETMAMSDQNS